MIKTKKWLLLAVCALCMLAALVCLPFTAYADEGTAALADEPNVIRKSDGTEPSASDGQLTWEYGAGDIIGYTYRPEHGDTVYYTLTKDGQSVEKFAAYFTGDTSTLYAVEGEVIDRETPFKVNSLNAYLKTLKTGVYTLTVSVPAGTAPATHSHWWNTDGEVACGITYSATTLSVGLTVNAYEITADNVGASTSTDANVTVKYSIQNPYMLYTGAADNLPDVVITRVTADGTTTLTEGEDYTLSSATVNVGNAALTITGIGGYTGTVTIPEAYKIVQGENSVTNAYVVRWKHGEYDREVNLFTADAKWGADDLYFAISMEVPATGLPASWVDGLDEIRLTEGMVSPQVEGLLNGLDAKTAYYLYAIVDGGNNYYSAFASAQFEVVEVTNTWTTTPSIVSWEWKGFDENVNVISATPAFGDSVKFSIYIKTGEGNAATDYTALEFGENTQFELVEGALPDAVVTKLTSLDAGTYYLFASVISDTDNYTSINETFSADALVPFRVSQARNYWTRIPQLPNWSYGAYDKDVNVISAASAHGSANIKYRIYKQTGNDTVLLSFGVANSFSCGADGSLPTSVTEGLKALGAGKYYLRAEVAATDNYTGLYEIVPDFTTLPSFEVIKAENYWSTAPAINAWSEGNYTNDDNLPSAAAHFGVARIVITDVNDAENVLYDSENNINKLAEAGVGSYMLVATVADSENYHGLNSEPIIFQIFVPETDEIGIAWWWVLLIVVCSLALLVFIFWLLHEKGVLQMLTGRMVVAMRTKATMDATIAAVRANKVAEDAKESVRLAEELDRLEAEKVEAEDDDAEDELDAVLIETDAETGYGTFVRYQKPFSVKLIQATDETKEYYSYLKNVLLSYKKVKSKLSKGYDAFNKGRNQLAKLVIRGKTLCLYLALNPDDYADTKYKVERSESKKFAEVPCLYRIRSLRRLRYAEELIAAMCEQLAIPQGENRNEDYRPPYESTEELLEKGLIKKVTYKRKLNDFFKDNQGASVAVKTDDGSELQLQEIAAAEVLPEDKQNAEAELPVEETTDKQAEASEKNEENAEEAEVPVTDEETPPADDKDSSVESDADIASDNSTDDNK